MYCHIDTNILFLVSLIFAPMSENYVPRLRWVQYIFEINLGVRIFFLHFIIATLMVAKFYTFSSAST